MKKDTKLTVNILPTRRNKEKSAAILTVFNISEMTEKGRAAIIDWIRQQAIYIRKYHKTPGFASRYTARYLYAPKRVRFTGPKRRNS